MKTNTLFTPMTTKTLYIKIFQPFAQYRNPFTFYYAQTYPLPPKSTIIGMLQNANERYYDQEFWKLKVSVHGGFESVFWNYQQLIKGFPQLKRSKDGDIYIVNQELPLYNEGFKSQRTPVHQQELFNGHLYIFIRGNKKLLNEIKDALDLPRKILYLGRSEDIIFIKRVEFVKENNIELKLAKKSLWLTYPTYIKHKNFPIKNKKYPIYSIPIKVLFRNNGVPIRNKAEISKNTERDSEFKEVIYTGFDYFIKLENPVSYEELKINGVSFRVISEFGWL